MKNLSILVVDDDPVVRRLLEQQLTKKNYFVQIAEDGAVAERMLKQQIFDVVITDLIMPGEIGGIEVLEIAKKNNSKTEVVVVTAHASIKTALKAMKKGAIDYLEKPLNYDELILRIDQMAKMQIFSKSAQDLQAAIDTTEAPGPSAIPAEKMQVSKLRAALDKVETILRDDLLPEKIKVKKALDIITNSRINN